MLSPWSFLVWSNFTTEPCSVTCGKGVIIKTRNCVDIKNSTNILDSSYCDGPMMVTDICDEGKCPRKQ